MFNISGTSGHAVKSAIPGETSTWSPMVQKYLIRKEKDQDP